MKFNCSQCNKKCDKKVSQKHKHHFCSSSCWATYSNLHDKQKYEKRKRKEIRICPYCNTSILEKRLLRCSECTNKLSNGDALLKDVIYKKHHRSSAYAYIRTNARAVAKKLGWNICKDCGYSKHIEIAHKKPVSDFDEDTPINVINHPDNLLPLCPNCHWEFDNKDKRDIVCLDCGVKCSKLSKRCKSCSRKLCYRKNSKMPSKQQLIKDFEEIKTFVGIASKYTVSDNAVRKWCKKYDMPTRRYSQRKTILSG